MKRRDVLMASALGLLIAPRRLFRFSEGKLGPMGDVAMGAPFQSAPKLVTMYFPNGCEDKFWKLDQALAPLKPLHDAKKVLLLENIDNPLNFESGRDAHEQGGASLFSGASLVDDSRGSGPSLDQIVSPLWNKPTPLGVPLVCSVWRGFAGGEYRSTSWSRKSWLANGMPVTPIQDPLDTFKSMLGLNVNPGVNLWRTSALDSVMKRYDEFSNATSKLSVAEKSMVNAHMESLREIEKSAARFSDIAQECKVLKDKSTTFEGVAPDSSGTLSYENFQKAYRLHMDLVALALSCGLTRSANLSFGSAGEEYVNKSISPHADHSCSHYDNDQAMLKFFLDYRKFHLENVVYFAQKLQQYNILDSTVIIAGTEFGESNKHTENPQPHVIVGGGDYMLPGLIDGKHMSNNDLYRTVLKSVGVDVASVGDKKYNSGSYIPGIIRGT